MRETLPSAARMPATSVASIESDQVIGGLGSFAGDGTAAGGIDGGAGGEEREFSAAHPINTSKPQISGAILFWSISLLEILADA